MYRVMVVDDEPIILSGIKFMIDWEAHSCIIVGTARNGQQAMEMIETLHPDIVICDINMPVMSGLDVLKAYHQKEFAPFFIMLTNHQEFDMARNSLRYKAVDYLLKNQLEEGTLEASLELAIGECEKKHEIAAIRNMDGTVKYSKRQVIAMELRKIIKGKPGEAVSMGSGLWETEAFHHFFLVEIFVDYPGKNSGEYTEPQDRMRIFKCLQELLETLLPKAFRDFTCFDPEERQRSFVICCWNNESDYEEKLTLFFSKFIHSSYKITQMGLDMIVTDEFNEVGQLPGAMTQLASLRDFYYWHHPNQIRYKTMTETVFVPLDIHSLGNKLIYEMRSKNVERCSELMEQIQQRFRNTPHTRDMALRECAGLLTMVGSVIAQMTDAEKVGGYFSDVPTAIEEIQGLSTSIQLGMWLEETGRQLLLQLQSLFTVNAGLREKIEQYILENLNKRIMLQDLAEYLSLSPNYLSSVFKKQYDQNLFAYINKVKIDQACIIIREGDYRIYEISYMLGFENAYYFTRLFKRHMCMTPKEYQNKIRGYSKS